MSRTDSRITMAIPLCVFLSILLNCAVVVHSQASVVVVAPGLRNEGSAVNVTLPETVDGQNLRVNITVNPDSSFNMTSNVGNSTSGPAIKETTTVTARPVRVKRQSLPVRVTVKPKRTTVTTTTTEKPDTTSIAFLTTANDEDVNRLSTSTASNKDLSTSASTSEIVETVVSREVDTTIKPQSTSVTTTTGSPTSSPSKVSNDENSDGQSAADANDQDSEAAASDQSDVEAPVLVTGAGSTTAKPSTTVKSSTTVKPKRTTVTTTENPNSTINKTTNDEDLEQRQIATPFGSSGVDPVTNVANPGFVNSGVVNPAAVPAVPCRKTCQRRCEPRLGAPGFLNCRQTCSYRCLTADEEQDENDDKNSGNTTSTRNVTRTTTERPTLTTTSTSEAPEKAGEEDTTTKASASKRPTTSSERRPSSGSKPENLDLASFLETPGNTVVVMSKRPNAAWAFGEDGSRRRAYRRPTGVRVISSSPFDTDSELVDSRPFLVRGVDLGEPEHVVIMDDQDL